MGDVPSISPSLLPSCFMDNVFPSNMDTNGQFAVFTASSLLHLKIICSPKFSYVKVLFDSKKHERKLYLIMKNLFSQSHNMKYFLVKYNL